MEKKRLRSLGTKNQNKTYHLPPGMQSRPNHVPLNTGPSGRMPPNQGKAILLLWTPTQQCFAFHCSYHFLGVGCGTGWFHTCDPIALTSLVLRSQVWTTMPGEPHILLCIEDSPSVGIKCSKQWYVDSHHATILLTNKCLLRVRK